MIITAFSATDSRAEASVYVLIRRVIFDKRCSYFARRNLEQVAFPVGHLFITTCN